MFFDRKFLSRQAYIQSSNKGTIYLTSVNISKLALRLSTFYKDDVISRNSPNMLAAYKMGKNRNNY
jgi:hypothetical protein